MNVLEKVKNFNCNCVKTEDKAWEILTKSWLTPAEISRATGITQPTIHAYAKDKKRMLQGNFSKIKKLAECYDEIVKEVKDIVKEN